MNSVILIGWACDKPELSYTPTTQTAVGKFTLAVNRPKRNGEDQGADFIRVTVWDKQAEICERYLHKGSQCAVRGRIQTGSYKGKNGETVYTTDVVADKFNGVEFLGSRGDSAPQNTTERQSAPQQTPRNPETTFSAMDEDCPF
jgi:single-strand DNA-binding protein